MQFTDLPPEVLAHILRQLQPDYSEASRLYATYTDKINVLQTIARVNKKCYELAVPILYSCINLRSWRREQCVEALLRALNAFPAHHNHIRHLALTLWAVEKADIMLKTLEGCTNLKSLHLHGFPKQRFHTPYIEQIEKLNLCWLHLQGDCVGPVLHHMLTNGAPKTLKGLKVTNVGMEHGKLIRQLLPSFTNSADIEELIIDTAFWSTKSITTLVHWPGRLRIFQCDMSRSFWESHKHHERLEPAELQILLDINANTLEHIEVIGWWKSAGLWDKLDDSMLDLSAHANLRHLQLHKRNILDKDPERMSSRLPPGLESLVIGLEIQVDEEDDSTRDGGYHRLDENDIIWLETFFDVRRQEMANHKLENVHIDYNFSDNDIPHCRITAHISDEPWPCQFIEDLASALTKFDVMVTNPKPYLSKHAWQLMIKDQTVPGWEYETTKAARLAVIPATPEELAYHYSDFYFHAYDNVCRQVKPHHDEDAEILEYKINTSDKEHNLSICSYFNKSCTHPVLVVRRVRQKYVKGFCANHDAPDCARTSEDLRRSRRPRKPA